jgi:3-isopropylmalate/(R)-2-methylmalate dehydratase large subunit
VGLVFAGIKAVIVKSVNRIFYRSSINQGLILIVSKEAVESYKQGDKVDISFDKGEIIVGMKTFRFEPLPDKLKQIIDHKGLVNYMKSLQ